ncbi:pirin-like bicupin family protein [Pseudoalteromonas sp. BDTF-M6]|uniref:pirin family protein n=1 Tax=Pseudoalteromonas sp. BDTF-M6 TaxID=2796132 RepID=UPI001BB0172C|nr:pirin-like bicupin family protein [Pseudoalteromonas sp. BDTF-M6]MBS3798337.1 pirin family protein [Pseudoalteromonas sp. BDTF-M6]
MKYFRQATERGTVDLGWLKSQHSFSFGHYYDPAHMGISALRVINEDRVQPGQGFDTHGHRDMEIISYVISGALKHKDSQGNEFIVPAGEVQRMSAGSGIMHSEYNASDSEPVHFLQIWIQPKFRGITPSYEQMQVHQHSAMTPLVTPTGEPGTLSINQDARISRLQLKPGAQYKLTSAGTGYLHLVSGHAHSQELALNAGDAFATEKDETVTIYADSALEALWFELP